MGIRERVHEAINGSTARAEKALAEAPHVDPHERLTILVNGWFQGIAAALEEIALELDARAASKDEPAPTPRPSPSTGDDDSSAAPEEAEPSDAERSQGGPDEAELLEQARESSKETQALRAERDSAPEGGQDS